MEDIIFIKPPQKPMSHFWDQWCVLTFLDRLSSYLDLWNAQVAAHAACDGDHMCLVGVWINKEKITGLLEDLVSSVGVGPFLLPFAHHHMHARLLLQVLLARQFNRGG